MQRFNHLRHIFISLALLTGAVQAQQMDHQHTVAAAATETAPMSTGEVIKIDKAQGKITLRHGTLVNLDMPGMTMAFKVAQPAMLEQVKPGDKVRFVADMPGGVMTIMALETAP